MAGKEVILSGVVKNKVVEANSTEMTSYVPKEGELVVVRNSEDNYELKVGDGQKNVQQCSTTPTLSGYVTFNDLATTSKPGVVKGTSNYGIALATGTGGILVVDAEPEGISGRVVRGQPGWGVISPSNIQFLPEALGLPYSQVKATAPTTGTVGKVGDLYVYKPANKDMATIYVCIAVDKTQTPAVYTWMSTAQGLMSRPFISDLSSEPTTETEGIPGKIYRFIREIEDPESGYTTYFDIYLCCCAFNSDNTTGYVWTKIAETTYEGSINIIE